jgi:hypothetical protein
MELDSKKQAREGMMRTKKMFFGGFSVIQIDSMFMFPLNIFKSKAIIDKQVKAIQFINFSDIPTVKVL